MRVPLLALVSCLVAASPALAGPLAFQPAGTVPTGGPARDVAAVDLTRDGRPDLVFAGGDGRVGILPATGAAAFGPPIHVPAGGPAPLDGLAVGHLDADGLLDVAVVNKGAPSPARVYVLRGNGAGLGVATSVGGTGDQTGLAIADLDFDGDGDIAVADAVADPSRVLHGDGLGAFPVITTLSAVGSVLAVATGDVTGDGLPDLHLIGTAGGFFSRNQGNGNFAAAIPQAVGGTAIAVGDVTGDGLLDRVSVGGSPARVDVAAGLGSGSFSAPAATALSFLNPTDVALADLDGDGRLDVVVSMFDGLGSSQVALLRSAGGGALEAPLLLAAGAQALAVAVADVDPDGRPDVLAMDTTGQAVVVLRNTTRFPAAAAVTGPAQAVTPTTAQVTGTIDPRGRTTLARVEYGLDSTYGLATADVSVGSGVGAVPVAIDLAGLAPGTTYHYRLVATGPAADTGVGADATFTTAPPPPTARLTAATVKRTWNESRVQGAVTVRGTASHTTQAVLVLLRPGKSAVLRRLAFRAGPGAFRRTLPLPKTLTPGSYVVELRGTVAGAPLAAVRRTVRLTAPREGVVDRAFASARRGSSPLLRVPGSPRQLWAHFRFAAAPKGRPITTTWYAPTGQVLVVPRPYRTEIHTFVAAEPSLARGRWRCVLRAGGKIVARIAVRVG